MNILNKIITKQKIPLNKKLKYLITIPCVNREERNAVNVIEKTFKSFENSGLFNDDIDITILLFESGSENCSYLNFINDYNKIKNKIQIINSKISLNGVSNTLRMFFYINKIPSNLYDFIIWMDDDVFVCNNFIKNTDAWIKNYANYSIFSSLYVPYQSYPILDRQYLHISNLHTFYGTCCVIFKPILAKYIIPHWFDPHFEKFDYNPDTRFRDSVIKSFPRINNFFVCYPSLVQHMNIGSAIKMKKIVNKGHKCRNFVGEENDPKIYQQNGNINYKENILICMDKDNSEIIIDNQESLIDKDDSEIIIDNQESLIDKDNSEIIIDNQESLIDKDDSEIIIDNQESLIDKDDSEIIIDNQEHIIFIDKYNF